MIIICINGIHIYEHRFWSNWQVQGCLPCRFTVCCVIQKSCFPCFKEEDVLWLNWKSNSKTKSPFVVFYVFASVYNMESSWKWGSAAVALSWACSVHWWILSIRPHAFSVPGNARAVGSHRLHPPLRPPGLSPHASESASQGKFLWELHLFFSPVVIFSFLTSTPFTLKIL